MIGVMSYPDAVYHGDSGEVSARLRPFQSPPDITYPNGTTVDYLATGGATDGRFGLYRWNMAPARAGCTALPPDDQRVVLRAVGHRHPRRRRA